MNGNLVTTPYVRGRAREYQALHMLRDQGWVCSRSAMSHGPVDIFAAKGGKVLLIQVKSGKGRITQQEVADLKLWAREFRGEAEIWFFRRKGGVEKKRISEARRR